MAPLPVLRAIEIKENPLIGGTTLPLLVIAENSKSYVIKLFSKKDASQRCYTAAEVFSNYLANEFELTAPNAVLIQIPPELIKLYKKTNNKLYDLLMQKDYKKPCFATEYLGDLPTFSPALAKKYMEAYDLETIYAFDALILNEDRKVVKPNILRAVKSYYLIDHDKAFGATQWGLTEYKNGRICPFSRNHLFFEIIKKSAKKEGSDGLFDTFLTYLEMLKINDLEVLRKQLTEFGYDTDDCVNWISYLYEIKEIAPKFATTLKESLL